MQQDQRFNYSQKQAVMARYAALSDRASGPNASGLDDVTHLIWPESAFPFFLTREADALAQIAKLLPEGTVLITGARARARNRADRRRHARLQFDLRARSRRFDPVDLRQGAPGSVRRVPAVSGFPRAAWAHATRPGERRIHSGRSPPRRRGAARAALPAAGLLRGRSFPARRCRAASVRAGCSTSPTTAGSDAAPAPTSTSSRRACAPSRKDCRWCAPPTPASRR